MILSVVYLVVNVLNLGVKSLVPVMLMESYENVSPALANGLNILLILVVPVGILIAKSRIFTKLNFVSIILFIL
jgi:hypothetical protein